MNVEDIQFSIGVVVSICTALIAGMAVWFAMKNQVNKISFRMDEMQKDLDRVEGNSEKNINNLDQKVFTAIAELRVDVNGLKTDIGSVKEGVGEIRGMMKEYLKGK